MKGGSKVFLLVWWVLQVNSLVAQYCVPTYENACGSTGAFINKFTFHTLNNSGSGCNGNPNNHIVYAPVGSLTTTVVQGSVASFTIKGGAGAGNQQGYAIWIDWNNDQDFTDADELVYNSSSVSSATVSGVVYIPFQAAYVGQRTLRVRSATGSLLYAQDACTQFANGETEDYMITVAAPASCMGSPEAGRILAFPTAVCQPPQSVQLFAVNYSVASNLVFQWQQSLDAVLWTDVPGASSASFHTDPLTSSMYFRLRVTCTTSALEDFTEEIFVPVGSAQLDWVQGDTLCGFGVAELKASGSTSQIFWYTSAQASIPVAITGAGEPFQPFADAPATYYASAVSGTFYLDSVGKKDTSAAGGSYLYANGFMRFDVWQPIDLVGVYVYPGNSGLLRILLRDQYFATIEEFEFVVSPAQIGTKLFLPLEVSISPGRGYQLFLDGSSPPLWGSHGTFSYPYTLPEVMSITGSNLGVGHFLYFYNWVVHYSTVCASERWAVPLWVDDAPPLEVMSSSGTFSLCAGQSDSLLLSATDGFASYSWVPATGLSATEGSQVKALPATTTVYTVTATLGICQTMAVVPVIVHKPPVVNVTPSHSELCAGKGIQLNASLTTLTNYLIETAPYVDEDMIGTPVFLKDDEVSQALPIGFSFSFFGTYYTHFYISSNGFIGFDENMPDGCCSGQLVPNPQPPNNLIAFAWEDLAPDLGGTISYGTVGTAPNRRLIVRFDSVAHFSFGGPVDPVTGRIELHESDGRVVIYTTSMPGNPAANWFGHTQAMENKDGTVAVVVPQRNASFWTAQQDAFALLPGEYTYQWLPEEGLDNASIAQTLAAPLTTTTYTVTVTELTTGCQGRDSVEIQVTATPEAGTITPPWTFLCAEDTVSLRLTNYTPGANLQWQVAEAGTQQFTDIAGAVADTLHFVTSTDTWLRVVASCAYEKASDTAVIKQLPVLSPPSGEAGQRCRPGKIILSATAATNQLAWYDSETDGTYLGSGTQLVIPLLQATDTFWVEQGPPPLEKLLSPFLGGENGTGLMFDITAKKDLVITQLSGHFAHEVDIPVSIYYRKGSFVGYEQKAAAWTLLGTTVIPFGLGTGVPTPIPIEMNLAVAANETIALYVTDELGVMKFDVGTQVGNVAAADTCLEIKEGSSVDHLFGAKVSARVWNGIVFYRQAGCSSTRIGIMAEVYYPLIAAASSDTTFCIGETITLLAVNNGKGTYNYQWYPILPNMFPENGQGPAVMVVPTQSTLFTLIATHTANQCDTIVQLGVDGADPPLVSFTGLPDTLDLNAAPVLLSGMPEGGQFIGPGIVGQYFFPNIAGTGWHEITYVFTDAQGCTGSAVQQVFVGLFTGPAHTTGALTVRVYPVPAREILYVQWSGPDQVERIIITTMDGRALSLPLHFVGARQALISVEELPPGMYRMTIYARQRPPLHRLVSKQ